MYTPTLIACFKHSYLIRPDVYLFIFLDAGCDIDNHNSTDYVVPSVYKSFFLNLLLRIQLTSDVIARAASLFCRIRYHGIGGRRIDGGGARGAGWARVPHCCGCRRLVAVKFKAAVRGGCQPGENRRSTPKRRRSPVFTAAKRPLSG